MSDRRPKSKVATRPSVQHLSTRYAAAALLAALVLLDTVIGRLPLAIAAAYLVMSGVSFALYAVDKGRAQRGEWRIPEATLHSADLLGGVAGGLVAQERIRHKTAKPAFAAVTYAIVILHAVVLLGIAGGIVTPDLLANILAELTA